MNILKGNKEVITYLHARDFGESEILMFQYDEKKGRIFMCIDDVSNLMGHSQEKSDYYFKYTFIVFHTINNYEESSKNNYPNLPHSFHINNENEKIELDKIEIKVKTKYQMKLFFLSNYMTISFTCEDIGIFTLPVYFKNNYKKKNYYFIDKENKKDFDVDFFLEQLRYNYEEYFNMM